MFKDSKYIKLGSIVLIIIILLLIVQFYPHESYCHRCKSKLTSYGIFNLFPHDSSFSLIRALKRESTYAYIGPAFTPEQICRTYGHIYVSKELVNTPFIEKPEVAQEVKKEKEEGLELIKRLQPDGTLSPRNSSQNPKDSVKDQPKNK